VHLALEARRAPLERVEILSPVSGHVIEKDVVKGGAIEPGMRLLRIAGLDRVWVEAEVYESELGLLSVGDRAVVTLPHLPGKSFDGRIAFVYPWLDGATRTGRVRIEIPNPDGRLKVDMYADVVFHAGADSAPVVAVPASAVIDSGTRQVVLVVKGGGRFEPRAVKLGRRGDGYVEVLDGVRKGEEVVTAATFLIDAESNLKAALQAFTQPEAPK